MAGSWWVALSFLAICRAEKALARVWWSPPEMVPFNFPELELPEVYNRANVALAFSGGGSRSYVASLGYMRGLKDLGLLDKPRYISGTSGGSWAVSVLLYNNKSDEEILGTWRAPEHITKESLESIPKGCARESATAELIIPLISEIAKGRNVGEFWLFLIWDMYLKPYGIPYNATFAFTKKQIQHFRQRNPKLSDIEFILPDPKKPFMLLGIALLGPDKLSPFPISLRKYTLLEATPLYVGQPGCRNVTYYGDCLIDCPNVESLAMGGFVETAVFGTIADKGYYDPYKAPPLYMNFSFDSPFTLREAVGLSSMAPASVVATFTLFTNAWLPIYNYTSPGDPSVNTNPIVLGDGGDVEEVSLHSALLRGVKSVILFCNYEEPLKPQSEYDPWKGLPSKGDIEPQMAAFFGISIPGVGKNIDSDLSRDQVFSTKDFPTVVSALQKAQAKGKGVVATTELVTVENTWTGLKAGIRCNVTWVYLSRAIEWENKLSKKLREQVRPGFDANNPSKLARFGPFRNFPHYSTFLQLKQSRPQINMLADLSAWVVHENKEIFEAAISPY